MGLTIAKFKDFLLYFFISMIFILSLSLSFIFSRDYDEIDIEDEIPESYYLNR